MKHIQFISFYPDLLPDEILYCPVNGCGGSFARRCTLLEHCNIHHSGVDMKIPDSPPSSEINHLQKYNNLKKTDLAFVLN
jgi:hypothetical protein